MLLTLDEWIARNAIAFAPDHAETLNAAVDELVATLDHSVGVLGFGEPMHGAEEFLELRNRFFQRLVEAHGYTAIAIESSFTKGRIVDDYVAGRRGTSYDAIQDHGFSHGFGASAANRALVEWMRKYNSEPKHRAKLRFWGFDSPTEMVGTDSPRQLLAVSLDYLDTTAGPYDTDRRHRIDELLGSDAPWEDPAASFDPAKAIGLSDAATALRIETEDLISELTIRRPELISASDADRYADAVRSANFARQMLNYHAGLAKNNSRRLVDLLGMRDVMMADNLVHIANIERRRGKVLAFAHNFHLQHSMARWQLGAEELAWWPAGAHLDAMLGQRYAVIGSAIGQSQRHGINAPEPGTLEARVTNSPSAAKFVLTQRGRAISRDEITAIPTRGSSTKNSTYFPLTPQSVADFDCLAVLRSID